MTRWTDEQLQAISLRNRNLLVAAAAGSGKTAVLVERIISMITDEKTGIDVDRLLVVTFTNAAAAEMRERISQAIENELENNPDNEHLQKQASLIHNAYIMTIDGFCKSIIQDNFQNINLDPSFRIADEGELKLLKADVLEKVLEEYYANADEAFTNFVESYSAGKTDKEIEEMILQLYNFSTSYPWPQKWLDECIKAYEIENITDLENAKWIKLMINNTKNILDDLITMLNQAMEIVKAKDGPYMYEAALNEDLAQIKYINEAKKYADFNKRINTISFARLSSKKDANVSDEKKEEVKNIRDTVKKRIAALKEKYFFTDENVILSDIIKSREAVEVLINLTKDFSMQFSKAKQEKNILDFSDLEHYALDILCYEENGIIYTTDTAKQLRENFAEVIIDEYQDSNLVQEYILTAVSGCEEGKNNIFMVGDVKQSIYKFRLARPEMFMEKYASYTKTDSDKQKIELHRNFRSRKQVLDSINFIFYQIMGMDLGNVAYDEDAALYCGSDYMECEDESVYDTELIIVDESSVIELQAGEVGKRELEAKAVAQRIKELINDETFKVFDKRKKAYRRCEYKDIVILLRTMSGWAEEFVKVFTEEGIPAYAGSRTGYFSTFEINAILNYLRIVDNPMQDIALTAVLASPIYSITPDELAQIKASHVKSMYQACREYLSEGENEALKEKLKLFFKQLEMFRQQASYMEIHRLIWNILDETGFGKYISVMPAGEQRSANMQMLIKKAINFEQTSYKGLFNFIRYIENLNKFEVDFGEAEIQNENDNAVRIMSIHKSKGLEFPVVFLSAMGKKFNESDARSKVIMHPDMGIGTEYIDYEKRTRRPTLLKKVLQSQISMENKGEELRVLYVAMTRAKEKLIMTGTIKNIGDTIKKLSGISRNKNRLLLYQDRQESTSYMDWVLKALIRHNSFDEIIRENDFCPYTLNPLHDLMVHYIISVFGIKDGIENEIINMTENKKSHILLAQGLKDIETDNAIKEMLKNNINMQYKYKDSLKLTAKVSVSDVKKEAAKETAAYSENEEMFKKDDAQKYIPKFIKEEEKSPALRGTMYHKVMELLDFKSIDLKKGLYNQIKEQLEILYDRKKIDADYKNIIYIKSIAEFFESNLGKRMINAAKNDRLYKEKQFVMGINANNIYPEIQSDDIILIQGIIDAFFIEDDKAVLMDYKTDHVSDEEELVKRYKIQLQLYEKALVKAYGNMKEYEMYIYSFALKKEIRII